VAITLAVTLLIFMAGWVRLAPHEGYFPIPGGYRAYSVYDIEHILRTGHEIRLSDKHDVTSYSSGIYLGTQDILRHKVDSAIILLLGLGPGDLPHYYKYGLWSPLLMFPLAALALYCALRRANGLQVEVPAALTILAFSVLGSFNMLSVSYHGETNTVTGWTFMFVALYGLVRIPDDAVKGRLLFFAFSTLVIFLYHTSAVLLACAVLSLATFDLLSLQKRAPRSHSAVTMLVVLLFVLTYFMYVSVSFFNLFAKTLKNAPSVVNYLLRQQSAKAPRDSALTDLLSTGDASFKVPMATLAALVAIPVVVVILMGLFKPSRSVLGDRSVRVLVPWLLGLVPFAAALFFWSGFSGVLWKAGEFGSLFAVVALAALFAARLNHWAQLLLHLLVVTCIGLSVFLFNGYERHGPSHLTYAEQEAATWLAARATDNEAVFTDLRLAAPLITSNHLAVIGINDYEEPETVRRWLAAIYYGTDPVAASNALHQIALPPHGTLRYAMFSRRAENDLPGIKGYDYNFKGAPVGYTDKLLRAPGFTLLYDNGTVRIFEVADAGNAGQLDR
jgi:hypothetical protein